jgi:hypothetical protein
MQTRLWALFMCMGLTAGCTLTREVGYEPSQISPGQMFQSVRGEDVTVTLENSRDLEGRLVAVTVDTLQLQVKSVDTLTRLPTSIVTSIYVAGSALGPIMGFLGGGLAGGAIGAVIGAGSSSSDHLGSSIGAAVGGAIGGLVGGIAGLAVGANATAAHEYIFAPGGIESKKPADTVIVQVKNFLHETESTVTIQWYGGKTTLPKSRISIQKTTDGIYIKVPRSFLYQDDNPRYIDSHE